MPQPHGERQNDAVNSLRFLEWGYKTAIVLSIAGMLFSAAYLFIFIYKSHPELIAVETMTGFSAERRMVLLSTGIFVAMSFGFLGFALFLIQAKGEVEGSAGYKDFKLNIARMSPGLFVILCATVIIIFCATFRIHYTQPVVVNHAVDTSFRIESGMPEGENTDTTSLFKQPHKEP